jgi:hypothetical protein
MYSPLGYLAENSLTPYPFKDGSTLLSTDRSYTLPLNLIVDLQITIKRDELYRFCLVRFSKDRPFGGTQKFSFIFNAYDADNTFVKAYTIFYDGVITPFEFISYTDDDIWIKLVPGDAFNSLNDGNELLPVFSYDFNALPLPTAEVESSAINLPTSRVKSVTFQNVGVTTPTNVITIDHNSSPPEVKVIEGTNVVLNLVNNTMEMGVENGKGTGLHDPCNDFTDVVKSINDRQPNAKGDFGFFGDDCFSIDKRISESAIAIEHTCEPRCSENEVIAYAYYINRLKDAVIRLSVLAVEARSNLIAAMLAYKNQVEKRQIAPAPFIEAEHVITKSTTRIFVSFAVGIYNPERTSSPTSPHVLNGSLTVTPEVNAGFLYKDGTSVLKEDGRVQELPSIGFPDRAITCNSAAVHEFVLVNGDILIANRHVEFLFRQTQITHASTAYKMEIVQPTNVYFTVKYKKIWRTDKFLYQFTIDLFDASITNANSVRNTNMSVIFSAGMTYVANTLVLNLNNHKTALTNSNPNVISFTNKPINFAQKATLTFDMNSLDGTFPSVIDMSTVSPGSSFSRNFTVL